MRRTSRLALAGHLLVLAGCGGRRTDGVRARGADGRRPVEDPDAAQKLGFPTIATKNTTRVAGADPVADAAGVALAVFPSAASGTHPTAVTLAPTDDWQAAIASSVLMAPPIRAPILLSGATSLPSATTDTLTALAPTGAGSVGGSAGDPGRRRSHTVRRASTTAISGADPYTLAAAIDRFVSAAAGKASQRRRNRIGRRSRSTRCRPRAGPPRAAIRSCSSSRSGIPSATSASAAVPPEAPYLRAGTDQRDPRQQSSSSSANTARSSGSALRTRRPTRLRSPSIATRRARPTSPARTCPAASAGRCEALAMATR